MNEKGRIANFRKMVDLLKQWPIFENAACDTLTFRQELFRKACHFISFTSLSFRRYFSFSFSFSHCIFFLDLILFQVLNQTTHISMNAVSLGLKYRTCTLPAKTANGLPTQIEIWMPSPGGSSRDTVFISGFHVTLLMGFVLLKTIIALSYK